MVIAPVTTTVSGLTTIGTGTGMYAGFRTATGGEFTTPLDFDNFAVDLPPAKMAYLAQPSIGVAGVAMGPFVVALEDSYGNIIVGDTSAVTLTLTHGTFSNGQSSVTANAVNGIATFNNLVISTPDSYILRATDANPNLDPGFGPVTVVVLPAVTTQPANQVANVGDTATFTAAASGSPAPTVQWQLSTDGGASFSNISGATSTTLTLTNVDSSLNNNEYRAIFTRQRQFAQRRHSHHERRHLEHHGGARRDDPAGESNRLRRRNGDLHGRRQRLSNAGSAMVCQCQQRRWFRSDRRRHLDDVDPDECEHVAKRIQLQGNFHQLGWHDHHWRGDIDGQNNARHNLGESGRHHR